MREDHVADPVEDDRAVSPPANCLAENEMRRRSVIFSHAARIIGTGAFALAGSGSHRTEQVLIVGAYQCDIPVLVGMLEPL